MKKILTIALILTNMVLVPLALAAGNEDPATTSAEACTDLAAKNYSPPDGFYDTEISEPLTGVTNTITIKQENEGVVNAFRNTYICDTSDKISVIESTACTGPGCYSSDGIQIIRSKSGTGLLVQYISAIFKWGASLAGMVAVVIIIWSGIQISTSQGKDVEGAKNRIIQSLSGLALLFLSGLLLYTINPTFFVK